LKENIMSVTRRGSFPVPLLRNLAALASLCTVLLAALPAQAQAQQPLSFFKNYFITGDYAVRGASLWRKGVNGTAVADIPSLASGGVPANADIVAAFLYVQTAESVRGSGIEHAKFLGFDLGPYTDPVLGTPGSGTYAKPLVAWENAPTPCWSVAVPGGRRLMTYRVDVLRFLPIDPITKKQDLTTPHRVSVPDAGRLFGDDDESCRETTPTSLPRALGASLVVVYRDPAMPFSAVVIYDGAYTKRALGKMVQPIEGFYQSSLTAPAAKMTHIVGDGRLFLSEQVLLETTLGTRQIAKNPYKSADGAKWDNPTFPDLPLDPNVGSTTVTVDRFGLLPDCLTFSAMVFKTAVQDSDGDGLVDRWETSPPPLDPNGKTLPDLGAIGASPDHKDLFVQIGYMYAAEGTKYGGTLHADGTVSGGTPIPEKHTHLPGQEALRMAAEAFNNAPVTNPDSTTGIRVHFDVGSNYQGLSLPYIIPESLARGGQSISETKGCPDPANPDTGKPIECATIENGVVTDQKPLPGQYPAYPGTVGWKTGFQLMRDELLRDELRDLPPGFDSTRKDIFHYVLFAHSIGIPKEACQITNANGDLVSDPACQDPLDPIHYKPDFNVPRTNSGIADFPGGDLLVTLGAFKDENQLPVGTPFMQGATLMHELGHNFELTHAGLHVSNAAEREPNCKPNYHSVMNYLYQLRGLPDFAGKVWMDYSAEEINGLDENSLSDNFLLPLGTPRYRSGWYAPLENSYLEGLAFAASKHCDGSPLITGEVAMVRVDAASIDAKIDWNADGTLNSAGLPAPAVSGLQDINFDGIFAPPLKSGSDDWANLRLSQLGGRRSTGGYYFDLAGLKAVGPLSLDIGRGDIGRGDIGRGDIGRGDIGRGDIGVAIGRGDIGRGDIGRGDIGRGDIGRGDIGRGDIGRGDIGRGGGDLDVDFRDPNVGDRNAPIGDLDLETSLAVTGSLPTDVPNSPANELTASLTNDGLPVTLNWQAPHLGEAVSYSVYRFEVTAPGAPFPPGSFTGVLLATLQGFEGDMGMSPPPTTYPDSTAAGAKTYAYYVVANFSGGISSGISNFARITTPVVVPAVNITSINPTTAAAGYGQMMTVFTTAAPAEGTPQAFFTQGGTTAQGFVWGAASQQNEYFVRLPLTLLTGPAKVRLVFGLNTITQDFDLTVSTMPGTPQARFVMALDDPLGAGACSGTIVSTTPITDVVAGQCIAISAYGIDTSLADAVFSQGATSITVAVKTTVNAIESALSNTLALTVLGALLDFAPLTPFAGDYIDRGFYVPSYPGATLSSVTVWMRTYTAGPYTLSMTARADNYGGTIIGTSSVTVSMPASVTTPVTFYFPSPAVAPGTTVTFAMNQVSPSGLALYYDVGVCDLNDANCVTPNPTIETGGTTPPLDTFRRNGVSVRIFGKQ
jgi:hypothetical protein